MVCTEMTLFAGGKLFKRKSLRGDGTIYRVLGRQEIQNFIGGDEITRGLARGENLTLYFHGRTIEIIYRIR